MRVIRDASHSDYVSGRHPVRHRQSVRSRREVLRGSQLRRLATLIERHSREALELDECSSISSNEWHSEALDVNERRENAKINWRSD